MSAAYSLINQGGVNEMVLVDVLKDKDGLIKDKL